MSQKTPILSEHFERLKELIPEVYSRELTNSQEAESPRLFAVLKKTLGIVEAIYLQNRDRFHQASVEEYGNIIQELKEMGYDYNGNEELLEKAANQLLLTAKKPMEKAKGKKPESKQERKAI